MKQRSLMLLCFVLAAAGIAAAQGKTVTNADLEKFRQKRVEAERGLRDYYERIGLTPAEVEKREADEARSRVELSVRLRSARLEQERADQERAMAEAAAQPQVNVFIPQTAAPNSGYFVYGDRLYPNRGPWHRRFPNNNGIVWRAGPGGVIYEPGSRSSYIYSPVPQQRTRPAWRNPRNPR